MSELESITGDATCDELVASAACEETMSDKVFTLILRALAGLDPLTGEPPVPSLPKRMTYRGWRRQVMSRVEVGQDIGWYWRCPRRSCPAWGGPFRHEHEAYTDGEREHHYAHKDRAAEPTPEVPF